jgi:hypothetical protein
MKQVDSFAPITEKMKNTEVFMRLAVTILSALTFNFAVANVNEDPSKVPSLPLTNTFVLDVFKENQEVEFVVTGILTNTCISPRRANIELIQRQFFVEIEGKETGCFCLPVETPFFKVIKLGKLAAGSYWVKAGDLSLVREIRVEPSTANQEDLAYVTSAKLIGNELLIRGKYFDSASYIESFLIERQLDATILVKPVLAERKGLKNFVTRTFEERVDLTEYVTPNFNHLVHIRAQNKSLNLMMGVFNDPKIRTKNEESVRAAEPNVVIEAE